MNTADIGPEGDSLQALPCVQSTRLQILVTLIRLVLEGIPLLTSRFASSLGKTKMASGQFGRAADLASDQ